MGGMLAPIPGIGKPAGRVMADIGTLGLAELLPNNTQDKLNNAFGSLFFSPLSGLAAGGAGLMGAGGIGAGGMGAAAPAALPAGATAGVAPGAAAASSGAGLEGLSQFAIPGAAGPTMAPTGAAAFTGGAPAAAAGSGVSGNNMLQNAFLATSVGGMLGNAIKPPPPPSMHVPNAPTGGGGSFTPVSAGASQQWAQLMAQRRAQQTGKFTV